MRMACQNTKKGQPLIKEAVQKSVNAQAIALYFPCTTTSIELRRQQMIQFPHCLKQVTGWDQFSQRE
ncbi:hypothetical protein Q4O60_13410 [Aeribacillus pallidus]|nr:hypothetical protein [Aeribacillus pallidus]